VKLDKILQARNEVWVKSEKGRFITMIDEVEGDTLTILGPAEPTQQHLLQKGMKLFLTCVTENGLYMFEAAVTNLYPWNNVMQVELKATSDYRRTQRREAYRVRENVETHICKLEQLGDHTLNWVKTQTVNISENGVLLLYGEECVMGQAVELELIINLYGMHEVLTNIQGRVARCISSGHSKFGYLLGIQFIDVPDNVRNSIIKFVVLSQRNKLTYHHTKRY